MVATEIRRQAKENDGEEEEEEVEEVRNISQFAVGYINNNLP